MPLFTSVTFGTIASVAKIAIPVVHLARKAYHAIQHDEGAASLFGEVVTELNAITASLHAAELHDLLAGRESNEVVTANQHFTAFIGFVLGKLVEAYAEQPQNKDICADLIELAKVLPDVWLEAAKEEAASLPASQARSFLDDLRSTLDGNTPPIDENELAAQLRRIARCENLVNLLPADILDRLSSVLQHALPEALASAIVHGNATSEAAFKKACLRFHNEVLGQIALVHDVVRKGNVIGEDTNRLVRCIDNKLTGVLEDLIGRRPINRYLTNLIARFSKHNSLGIPVVEDTEQKQGPDEIKDLFVKPTCTAQRLRPEDLEAVLKDDKNRPAPLLPLLATERRVVLLADPGMGKSTLIQWLVVTLAHPTAGVDAMVLGRGIPVPLILLDLEALMPKKPEDWNWKALLKAFLDHRFDEERPGMAAPLAGDAEAWHDLLASPNSWFLIDGLDEIGDKERRIALRNAIWEGFAAHPQARFLITSRIVGYDEAVVHVCPLPESAEFIARVARRKGVKVDPSLPYWEELGINPAVHELADLLYLAPWDDPQQSAFSQKWFRLRLGDSDGPVRARDFVSAVHSHPSTQAIGRVPNLLLLMALLYRYRADLPHGRAKVYAGISQAYLENIASVRRIDHRTRGSIPYRLPQKERLLAIIAMHMQIRRSEQEADDGEPQESEILASRSDLESWLSAEFGKASDAKNKQEMKRFLDHIADSSGLLIPRGMKDGQEQFAFTHLSFQEYYAACWLELEFSRLLNLKAGGDDLLDVSTPEPPKPLAMTEVLFAHRAALPGWREPLLFLAEKLSERPADTLTLRKWLFPIREGKPLPVPAQQLLATLSIDPQVSFSLEQRHALWEHLWHAHLLSGRSWLHNVAQSLLEISDFQRAVLNSLVRLMMNQGCKRLDLSGCTGVRDITPLSGLASLRELHLTDCTGVTDLSPLAGLAGLEQLSLEGCTGVRDLSALAGLKDLQKLSIEDCTGVSDLGPCVGLARLQGLWLSGCTGVSDITPLSGLASLRELHLTDCTGVTDLSPLAGLAGLEQLSLEGCTGVRDLSALAGLKDLQKLSIEDCTGVRDLGVLVGLRRLRHLYPFGCTGVSNQQIEDLRSALPRCDIRWAHPVTFD